MNQNTKELLLAMLEGKTLVWKTSEGYLQEVSLEDVIGDFESYAHQCSIKPYPTYINVNGIKVSHPLTEAPKIGTVVYQPHPGSTSGEFPNCYSMHWDNSDHQNHLLEQGLLHSTLNAASVHGTAMMNFSEWNDD